MILELGKFEFLNILQLYVNGLSTLFKKVQTTQLHKVKGSEFLASEISQCCFVPLDSFFLGQLLYNG